VGPRVYAVISHRVVPPEVAYSVPLCFFFVFRGGVDQ
jgi:hypothetical protein